MRADSRVSRTEEEARENGEKADPGYTKYHVRRVGLILERDMIRHNLQVELFDHCDIKKLLDVANGWATKSGWPR